MTAGSLMGLASVSALVAAWGVLYWLRSSRRFGVPQAITVAALAIYASAVTIWLLRG